MATKIDRAIIEIVIRRTRMLHDYTERTTESYSVKGSIVIRTVKYTTVNFPIACRVRRSRTDRGLSEIVSGTINPYHGYIADGSNRIEVYIDRSRLPAQVYAARNARVIM